MQDTKNNGYMKLGSNIAYVLDEAGIYSNDLVELLEGKAKIEA